MSSLTLSLSDQQTLHELAERLLVASQDEKPALYARMYAILSVAEAEAIAADLRDP